MRHKEVQTSCNYREVRGHNHSTASSTHHITHRIGDLHLGAAGVAVTPAGLRLVEEQCEQAIYRQEQQQQKGRRETVGAMVQCTCSSSRREEKRQAGGCRGAGAFSSGGSSRPRRREAPREAAAGRHERRNSSHQRSLCTRRGRATPSSNFREEINAKKLSFYAPLQNNIFHLLETMHYKSRL